MQVEVHAPVEPPEPGVPTVAQIPDEGLDQVRHHPSPKDPVEEETEVCEMLQLPRTSPHPKPMVLGQPLPQVLHMPRPMPLPGNIA